MKKKVLYRFAFALTTIWQTAFAWPGGSNDFDAYNEAYESMTAEEKENTLFQNIEESEGTKGKYPNLFELALLFTKDLSPTVDNYSDFVPYDGGKGIHSVGAVGKIKFNTENATANHPFTGIFAEGAPHGLIRLSLALSLQVARPAPGLGVKFFRDGMPSANLVAMESVDGQDSGNFFERDFTNHIPTPEAFIKKLMAEKFARTSDPPEMVGLSDIASFDAQGNKVDCDEGNPIVFPFEIILKPNPTLQEQFSDLPGTDEDIEYSLLSIPEGTELYEVYARTEPQDVNLIKLGTFELTSKLKYSSFGDNGIFFRHQRIEEDLELRPEWKDAVKGGGGLRNSGSVDKERTSSKCPILNRHLLKVKEED